MTVATWSSPVSLDATATARLLRESMDALGWKYEPSLAERTYTRLFLVLGLPKTTLAHRFRVAAPVDLTVEAYDTHPTPTALMPYLEVRGISPEDREDVARLLAEVARRAPRPPWRFAFRQRLALGLLAPEFRRARKAWRAVGVAE